MIFKPKGPIRKPAKNKPIILGIFNKENIHKKIKLNVKMMIISTNTSTII